MADETRWPTLTLFVVLLLIANVSAGKKQLRHTPHCFSSSSSFSSCNVSCRTRLECNFCVKWIMTRKKASSFHPGGLWGGDIVSPRCNFKRFSTKALLLNRRSLEKTFRKASRETPPPSSTFLLLRTPPERPTEAPPTLSKFELLSRRLQTRLVWLVKTPKAKPKCCHRRCFTPASC